VEMGCIHMRFLLSIFCYFFPSWWLKDHVKFGEGFV
jgi:hypothetical protein